MMLPVRYNPKLWNTIGVVYIDRGRRFYNYLTLPLQARTLDGGKTYQYRAIYTSIFGRPGGLPILTQEKKLYTNDIVQVQLNTFLGQSARGKVRIYYNYF